MTSARVLRSIAPDRYATAVLDGARALSRSSLVVGTTGNVSARVPAGMLITPTRASYEQMHEHDLVVLTLGGMAIGSGVPSREWPLHAAVYTARPDVGAIVHTHSVHATAWSFLGEPLEPQLEEHEYYGLGQVRTTTPAAAGSEALASAAVCALGQAKAVLLGGHGVLTVGATVQEAVMTAEVVERHAQILWLLRGERRASQSLPVRPSETHAVVPFEPLDALALATLSDTLLALRRMPGIARTVAVGTDARARAVVRDPRVRVIVDNDATSPAAAARIGVAAAIAAGAAQVLLVPELCCVIDTPHARRLVRTLRHDGKTPRPVGQDPRGRGPQRTPVDSS